MDANQLISKGYAEIPDMFAATDCNNLLSEAMRGRPFDQSIFLSEAQWEASTKSHRHVSPGPGYNALEKLPEGTLNFVDENEQFKSLFSQLLGNRFHVISRRLICRLPWSNVPDWFAQKRFGQANNALGAFIKPEYRDISYFLDVDMHQDIQDHLRFSPETRTPHYFTFYVYLGDVGAKDAPIQLMPGSHCFGATRFQHDVRHTGDVWQYHDKGRVFEAPLVTLTGKTGYAALWHNCILHGTPPVHDGHFRLSLRYLVARDSNANGGLIEKIERSMSGPFFLDTDQTPGANAKGDGFWNMEMSDYLRYSYRDVPAPSCLR